MSLWELILFDYKMIEVHVSWNFYKENICKFNRLSKNVQEGKYTVVTKPRNDMNEVQINLILILFNYIILFIHLLLRYTLKLIKVYRKKYFM